MTQTPGMEVVLVADVAAAACVRAMEVSRLRGVAVERHDDLRRRGEGEVCVVKDALAALEGAGALGLDVVVECTNTIAAAGRHAMAAMERGAHVVLMNAEVDLALGRLLAHEAKRHGVVVTSDAGDQHGVLATMLDEIELWGFRVAQAGNMKGFLDRYAVAATAREWAEKQRLSVTQTVAYTDGTKMNIEQALIGNHAGLAPARPGMTGPRVNDLREVLAAFDFDGDGGQGRIDYTLGVPWPGGGVYVVAECRHPLQTFYLDYYKVSSRGPYHLFFRPYHLCHIETPRAIAQAYLDSRPVIAPARSAGNDVFAYAKRDLPAGTEIAHGIGGDEVYGLVDAVARAGDDALPVSALEGGGNNGAGRPAVLTRAVKRDDPVPLSAVEIPDNELTRLRARQDSL